MEKRNGQDTGNQLYNNCITMLTSISSKLLYIFVETSMINRIWSQNRREGAEREKANYFVGTISTGFK